MKPVVDFNANLYRTYHQARQLSPAVMDVWMNAVADHLACWLCAHPDRLPLTILDLGCGTGRFSGVLADRFDAQVIGVEPAERMREQAMQYNPHERVRYVAGCAEHIPLGDGSCDVAWLSTVWHHFRDPQAAARELARVVRPGGLVFIRGEFRGRMDWMGHRYFPSARAIDEKRMPSVEELASVLAAVGIRMMRVRPIQQAVAPDMQTYAARLRMKGISTLELISEEEFQAGLQAIEAAAAAQTQPRPVVETIDLLVLRREGCCRE